jgi:hypothetical protein
MPRGLSASFKTALGGGVLYPALFAQFEFDGGTSRYWTGAGAITADLGEGSVSWTGGALLGTIEMSGEGENLEAKSMRFSLNAVDRSYYSLLISEEYRGRPCKVWFALMSGATSPTVSYYELMEEARMDVPTLTESADGIEMSFTAESRLIDLFRARPVYLTPDYHNRFYPEDTFYEFTPTLPGKPMPWGSAFVRPGTGSSRSGGGLGSMIITKPG